MKKLIDASTLRISEDGDGYILIHFDRKVNGVTSFLVRRTKSGRFECPMCFQRLISLAAVESHLRTPHHKCPNCEHSFINLKSHLKFHRVREKNPQVLEMDALAFVRKCVDKNYSLYEIDKAIGNAFSYFVPE